MRETSNRNINFNRPRLRNEANFDSELIPKRTRILNDLTDKGKHLETIKEKYIIHKVNDNKLAIISDVRVNGKNYEAIINYDNENYLVKDFGVRKGMFDYYKLDNKIEDSTFEAYDKTEIYSTVKGICFPTSFSISSLYASTPSSL